MHKPVPKMRYIAASNKCSTKPLSRLITKCLKLITVQHRKYCSQIYRRTGVNRMWIVDNNTPVLERILEFNNYTDRKNADIPKNVSSYDFSTLYTKITHTHLKQQMKWILRKAFNRKKCMYVNVYHATWYKLNDAIELTKQKLFEHICFLIDNIYITVGNHILRQVIGIPMGTDCAPYLANVYLYSLEFDFLEKAPIHLARKFSNSYRYIDDLLSFNNNNLINQLKHRIYPTELILNKENKSNNHTSFLDINITIQNNKILTKLYDKRNDFKFTINSFHT